MRTFIKLGTGNIVESEVSSQRAIGPQVEGQPEQLPAGVIEVTNRTDGSWIGKIYNAQTDTFTVPTPAPDSPDEVRRKAILATDTATLSPGDKLIADGIKLLLRDRRF